ncbi:MAG: FtsX-like permease family protein [Myxococcota bacterium]
MWTAMIMGARNLLRHRLRTGLTIVALVLGTFFLVFIVGLNEGTYADMTRMATSTWNGQLQVLHEEYHDSPSLFESIKDPAPILDALSKDPDVVHVTARVEAAGLFSAEHRTAGGLLTGVMPEHEPQVSTLPNSLKEGTFLGQTRGEDMLPIVLGDGLATRLKVSLGAQVVYLGQAADGSMAAELFEIVGIMDSGIDELDASMAFIRLQDAQQLFVLGTSVHRVVAKTQSAYGVERIKARHEDFGETIATQTWDDLMPEIKNGIEADREGGRAFLFIIIFMVILGTVNTLMMSVLERTKEFGVMKALGTPRWQIIAMIIFEGAWLSILGVGVGVLLASALHVYLAVDGLQMLENPVEFGGMSISVIYPANTLLGNVIYPGVLVGASILGAVWPAWRASNLDPVAALRSL